MHFVSLNVTVLTPPKNMGNLSFHVTLSCLVPLESSQSCPSFFLGGVLAGAQQVLLYCFSLPVCLQFSVSLFLICSILVLHELFLVEVQVSSRRMLL